MRLTKGKKSDSIYIKELAKYGFKDLLSEEKDDLNKRNSKLKPLVIRYQGMGCYNVICKNKCIKNNKCYIMVMMGGPNGYEVEYNYNEYKKINEKSDYKKMSNLLDELKKTSWIEIVGSSDEKSKNNDSGVVLQRVVEHFGDDVENTSDESGNESDSSYQPESDDDTDTVSDDDE